MVRQRSRLVLAALALAGAVALIPVFAHEGHGKTQTLSFDPNAPKLVSPATAEAIGLATGEVDFGAVEDVVRLTGVVEPMPDRRRAVAPVYAGIVRSIGVQPGDVVRAGDVVAELDSTEVARARYELERLVAEREAILAEVTKAEAGVASLRVQAPALAKEAQMAQAEADRLGAAGEGVSANLLAQRTREALKLRTDAQLAEISLEQTVQGVESLRRQAEANERSAEALRATLPDRIAGASPGAMRLVAPIDGLVVARTGVAGAGVAAGESILTIADLSSVQVFGEVPESLVDRLAPGVGAVVRIRDGAGRVIAQGAVRFVSPVIEPTKRTAHLVIDAPNPDGALRQGQFVELAVVLGANEFAVVVPASAIVKEGPLEYVFVQDHDVFVKRDVATGLRDDRIVEIRQGLVPGDVVAVGGAFSLSQLRGVGAAEPEPADPHAGHSH